MSLVPEEILLDPSVQNEIIYDMDYEPDGAGEVKNILVLSFVFVFALLANLAAFPVILFRRTRFGNGQFAVLILCLTVTDLLTILVGILGGLILEAGGMSWVGSGSGCAVYYFITSWLLGLSNYLIVCLVCMILVKRSSGILSRLQECRLLLLSLLSLTLLPAIPELGIRSTFSDPLLGAQFCIIATQEGVYGLYVVVKFLVRHLLPLVLVILCILKPRTRIAKRVSLVLVGEPAACECGPSGSELARPHECPKMSMSRCRPDLLRDTDQKTSIPALLEDPVRRRYKLLLATSFIISCSMYLLVESIFHIQSAVTESWLQSQEVSQAEFALSNHAGNLATALHFFTFAQLIVSPVILVYAEYCVK